MDHLHSPDGRLTLICVLCSRSLRYDHMYNGVYSTLLLLRLRLRSASDLTTLFSSKPPASRHDGLLNGVRVRLPIRVTNVNLDADRPGRPGLPQSESASRNGITRPTITVHPCNLPLPSRRDEAIPVKVDAIAEVVPEPVLDVASTVVVADSPSRVDVDTAAVVVESGLTPGVMVMVVRIEFTTASSGRTSVARPLGRVDP